ncbi:MAG: hypothetical protein GC200_00110 [Tepidisphaera sp.]|nr:hypothetical protein [Tepidisphaera sp.]
MDDLPSFRPLGLLGACLFPGLGHILNGEVRRGVYIASGILGLFLSGLLVGGIDTIDSKEDRPWFLGQALVGPLTFAVDFVHQHHFKVLDPQTKQLRSAYPGEGRGPNGVAVSPSTPPNIKSIGKMNELGTLFSTVAGMINVIVIIDAGWPTRRQQQGKA